MCRYLELPVGRRALGDSIERLVSSEILETPEVREASDHLPLLSVVNLAQKNADAAPDHDVESGIAAHPITP